MNTQVKIFAGLIILCLVVLFALAAVRGDFSYTIVTDGGTTTETSTAVPPHILE